MRIVLLLVPLLGGFVSACVGLLVNLPLPRWARETAWRTVFVKGFGVRAEDAEKPLADYPTAVSFFTRKLRPGLRPFEGKGDAFLSPCDGVVSSRGTVEKGTLFQAKGRNYRLSDLLGARIDATRYEGGRFVTIYLSPKDYHRVHVPKAATLVIAERIPGSLYPVNDFTVTRVDRVFARNRRLLLDFDDRGRPFHLALIGALNVGQIPLTCRPEWKGHEGVLEPKLAFSTGDDLAAFELGSTVILILPATPDRGDCLFREGERVLAGQPLFRE